MKRYPVQVIFREYFEGIAAAIILAVFLRVFVFSVLYMPTENMLPGLQRGDFVLGWKLAYGFPLPLSGGARLNGKLPRRGDVVSFRFPGDIEQMIIRRVIALPGDKISIAQGRVVLNGVEGEYSESKEGFLEDLGDDVVIRLKGELSGDMAEIKVPEGQLFVLSDQRNKQDDSRSWGVIPLQNLESQLKWVWLSVDNQDQEIGIRWPRFFHAIR